MKELISKLTTERNDTKLKIDKLEAFLRENVYTEKLSEKHKDLLRKQFCVMNQLSGILSDRIEDLEGTL